MITDMFAIYPLLLTGETFSSDIFQNILKLLAKGADQGNVLWNNTNIYLQEWEQSTVAFIVYLVTEEHNFG